MPVQHTLVAYDGATGVVQWQANPSTCWGVANMVVDVNGLLFGSASCDPVADDTTDTAVLFGIETTTGASRGQGGAVLGYHWSTHFPPPHSHV